jgi:hypothetical protein
MGFSAKQVQALRRHPDHRHIRTREAHGRELTYLEGWYAISEANRIFGFDGWNRETIESRCVHPIRITCGLPNPERWVSKSATSSPYPSAAVIIVRFTATVTRLHGGASTAWIH